MDESTLALYYWNGNCWVKCSESEVNTVNNYVWAKLYHFSTYAPIGMPPTPP
jgi:hypothetical protein